MPRDSRSQAHEPPVSGKFRLPLERTVEDEARLKRHAHRSLLGDVSELVNQQVHGVFIVEPCPCGRVNDDPLADRNGCGIHHLDA